MLDEFRDDPESRQFLTAPWKMLGYDDRGISHRDITWECRSGHFNWTWMEKVEFSGRAEPECYWYLHCERCDVCGEVASFVDFASAYEELKRVIFCHCGSCQMLLPCGVSQCLCGSQNIGRCESCVGPVGHPWKEAMSS